MSQADERCSKEEEPVNVPKTLLAAATLFATLLVSGCPRGDGSSSGRPARERPPLRPPKKRLLEREAEAAVMDLMDDLRCDEYLKRIKAEEELDELMEENPVAVAPYLVQLLDEPQLDIRVAVIRMFVKHMVTYLTKPCSTLTSKKERMPSLVRIWTS